MSTSRTLTLENDLQYGSFTDHHRGEYWVCSPYNGAPLMRICSDVKYILHMLNTGQWHLKVEEVTRRCTTTGNYYQVWEYTLVIY